MSSKRSLRTKLVLSLGTLGIAAAVMTNGSFATFNAQTNNDGNSFASGTLVMSNKVNSGTACLSTSGGTTDVNDNTTGCDAALSLSVQKPGDSGTANITVKNEGSLAALALKVFSPSCTNADASAENYHGTGLPCSKVQFYIQQYSDAGFSTPSACLYGGATVANTCDFSDAAKTLSGFVTAAGNATNGPSAGAVAAGGLKYFTVGVKLPSDADNTFQGRKATFDLTWYMHQA